jgi:hypothetical protein
MPQVEDAMVRIFMCPSLLPVEGHVFVAALRAEETVQNRRIAFCDNSVAHLCKKMENAMKSF